MSKNKNNWFKNSLSTNTLFVLIMGLLALVPLVFSTILFIITQVAIETGTIPQAILLGIFALIFLTIFYFYSVLVHSLIVSNAYLTTKAEEQTLMKLFKHMRSVYWRLAKLDLIGIFATLIPLWLMGTAYTLTTNLALAIIGWSILIIYPFLMIWVPYHLVNAGLIYSIKKSFNDVKKEFIKSLKAYIIILVLGVALTIIWMASIWGVVQQQSVFVQNGVALMNLFTYVMSTIHVFPMYFLRGGESAFLQGGILLLHVVFVVFGNNYLFSAAIKKNVRKARKKK